MRGDMVLTQDKPIDPQGLILDAWLRGSMVGSVIVMAAIAMSNMRRKVLLHKLILVEVSRPLLRSALLFGRLMVVDS